MRRNKKVYTGKVQKISFPSQGSVYIDDKEVVIKNAFLDQEVEFQITKKKNGISQGKLISVIEKADYEIEPFCPHAKECGGCNTQNMSYEDQIKFKEQTVKDIFEGIDIKYEGIIKSPSQFYYRNKMEFTFGDEYKEGELNLGLHKKNSQFSIINVHDCKLIDEDILKIQRETIKYFREKDFDYYRVMKHEGFLRNLLIRKGINTNEIMVGIVTTSQSKLNTDEYKERIMSIEMNSEIKSLMHIINDGLSDTVRKDELKVLHGEQYITEEVLGLKFKISPFSFFQTNTHGAEKLYSKVLEYVGEIEGKNVFDLYSGTGTIGSIASLKAKNVYGIEICEEAVLMARDNKEINKIQNAEFLIGDVEKTVEDLAEKNIVPDIIVVDPPRPGITGKALRKIANFGAEKIIYVSCNPKTLRDDLEVLGYNGYKPVKYSLCDMFPNTAHIETVMLFNKG